MDNGSKYEGITMFQLVQIALDISRIAQELKGFVRFASPKKSEQMARENLDSADVMKILKISRGTLKRLCDDKILPYTTIGRKFYYKASDVEALLKSNDKKQPGRIKKHHETYY